jgi:hypothetical protein
MLKSKDFQMVARLVNMTDRKVEHWPANEEFVHVK